MAIIAALTATSMGQSALYMMLFGLGTLPLMAATALAGQLVSWKWRKHLRKVYPLFMLALALFFIYRGLSFNVPPGFSFWESMQDLPMCH